MNDSVLVDILKNMSRADGPSNNGDWVPLPDIYDMVADVLGPIITDALVCAGSAIYGAGPPADTAQAEDPTPTTSSSGKRSLPADDAPTAKRLCQQTPVAVGNHHPALPASPPTSTYHRYLLPPPPYHPPSPMDSIPSSTALPPPYRPPLSPPTVSSPSSPPPPYYPPVVDLSTDEEEENDCDIIWSSCVCPSNSSGLVQPVEQTEPLDLSMNNSETMDLPILTNFDQYESDEFGGEGWSDWSADDF